MISARVSKVSFGSVNDTDDTVLYRYPPCQVEGSKGQTRKASLTPSNVTSFAQKHPGFGLVSFFTLRVLFIDILIAAGDVVSDYAQGYALLTTPDNWIYGLVTIGINSLPGLVAAIHVISMYRRTLPAKKTLVYACLLLVFYPIVPLVAYFFLLWNNPIDAELRRIKSKKTRKSELFIKELTNEKASPSVLGKKTMSPLALFHEAEYFAMIAHAISGGIESPIQFVLQVWLIINGKIPRPWGRWDDRLIIKDWHGNAIYLPTTSGISLIFSIASMVKAVIEFNIIRVHIQGISTSEKFIEFCYIVLDHLPFLVCASFFRIASMAILITYMNSYGFIPIGVYWIGTLMIGYRRFKLDKIPLWLISFISLFFPACFTSHPVKSRNRPNLIELQYSTFFKQTMLSVLIYIPSLIVVLVLVNNQPSWGYDSNVILNNVEFNVAVIGIMSMGIVSLYLSIHPNWVTLVRSTCKFITEVEIPKHQDDEDSDKEEQAVVDPDLVSDIPNAGLRAIQDENRLAVPPVLLLTRPQNDEDVVDGGATVTRENSWAKRTKCRCSDETMLRMARMVLSLLIIAAIFAPLIVPSIILQFIQRPYSFVYYKVSENHTNVVQAIHINDFGDNFVGCLKFIPKINKDSTDLQNKSDHHNQCNLPRFIIQVDRSNWLNCKDSHCYKDASAVIVVDDNFACNLEVDRNCFRPSFPLSDITYDNVNMPVLLVQGIDADKLLPNETYCAKAGAVCNVGIAMSNTSIPEPMFVCDASNSDMNCIREPIQENGAIGGRQYRTLTCLWGNRVCFGYTNQRERQLFCNQPDVRYKFCKPPGHDWLPDIAQINQTERLRKFRMRGRTSGEMSDWCLSEASVKSCDKSSLPLHRWSKCTLPDAKSHRLSRFCQVSSECFLEEFDIPESQIFP